MTKVVLVSERQIVEGIVAGLFVGISSIVLMKLGYTTKVFRRLDFDKEEAVVLFFIALGWLIVWCFRKASNTLYDEYLERDGNKMEIAYTK
jgi:predicted membrane channel-forming protein YqfA (hemolysin III family)